MWLLLGYYLVPTRFLATMASSSSNIGPLAIGRKGTHIRMGGGGVYHTFIKSFFPTQKVSYFVIVWRETSIFLIPPLYI